MILIPRFQDVIFNAPRRGNKVGGVMQLTKGKNLGYMDANSGVWVPGKDIITGQTDPFKNIITNTGLDALASNPLTELIDHCHCGTGTNTEAAGDSTLQTHVAYTATVQSSSEGVQSSAPYYAYRNQTLRFGEGVAEGVIAEVGFGPSSSNANLFSRARVKDGGGSPTTITVLSNEWLDVSYQVRNYPDHINTDGTPNDGTGSIDISGTTYNYTVRPALVNSVTYQRPDFTAQYATATSVYGTVYGSDAALGAVTANPSATLSGNITSSNSGAANATYNTGTYNRDVTYTLGLTAGNLTGGIKAYLFLTGFGGYQILLDAAIPKDATKVLTLVANIAWTRATIA